MRGLPSAVLLALVALASLPACAPAASPQGLAHRGVQLHALWPNETPASVSRELRLAASSGADVVRVDVAWASLEPVARGRRSGWYASRLDRLFAGAARRHLAVVATLWATPCWSSTAPAAVLATCNRDGWSPTAVTYPPADAADYASVVAWLRARYRRSLAAIEVWNEPDESTQRFWRGTPAAYAALLADADAAAGQGAGHVPVLAGALAGADGAYLERLYAAGIRGHYDGISLHPYGPAATMAARVAALRATQASQGDASPLWVTEFGWTTGSGSPQSTTPAGQAAQIPLAFSSLGALGYVRAAIVYELRDSGPDPAAAEDAFGLVTRSFRPKPALTALRRALGAPAASRARRRRA